jgi:hypothetical protein
MLKFSEQDINAVTSDQILEFLARVTEGQKQTTMCEHAGVCVP